MSFNEQLLCLNVTLAGFNADISFFGRDVTINPILGYNYSFPAAVPLINGEGDVSLFRVKLPPVKQQRRY